MTEKLQNITVNNGEGEKYHCDWIKTIMIYINDLIAQKSNFQCNNPPKRVVVLIDEEE